jgi:hypothetical protein
MAKGNRMPGYVTAAANEQRAILPSVRHPSSRTTLFNGKRAKEGRTMDGRDDTAFGQKVLVLTPVKDAARHLERYIELLEGLSYPRSLLSLGRMESDS